MQSTGLRHHSTMPTSQLGFPCPCQTLLFQGHKLKAISHDLPQAELCYLPSHWEPPKKRPGRVFRVFEKIILSFSCPVLLQSWRSQKLTIRYKQNHLVVYKTCISALQENPATRRPSVQGRNPFSWRKRLRAWADASNLVANRKLHAVCSSSTKADEITSREIAWLYASVWTSMSRVNYIEHHKILRTKTNQPHIIIPTVWVLHIFALHNGPWSAYLPISFPFTGMIGSTNQ
jgi:hypothetical protein